MPSIEQKKKDTEVSKRQIRDDIKVVNKKFGKPMLFMSITESRNRGTPHKHSMIFDKYEMPYFRESSFLVIVIKMNSQ